MMSIKLHIGFPVGTKCTDIFPIAIELIRKETLSIVSAVRQDMFAEITAFLFPAAPPGDSFQCLPAENVDTHRCQVASPILRFFLNSVIRPVSSVIMIPNRLLSQAAPAS